MNLISRFRKELRFLPAFTVSSLIAYALTVPMAPIWVASGLYFSHHSYFKHLEFPIFLFGWGVAAIAATTLLTGYMLTVAVLMEKKLRAFTRKDFLLYFSSPFFIGSFFLLLNMVNNGISDPLGNSLLIGGMISCLIGSLSFAHFFHKGIQKMKMDEFKGAYVEGDGFSMDDPHHSELPGGIFWTPQDRYWDGTTHPQNEIQISHQTYF